MSKYCGTSKASKCHDYPARGRRPCPHDAPGHRARNNLTAFLCLSCVENSEGDCRLEVEELQHRRRTGIAASLLEVGTVGDEQSTFVPRQGAGREIGLSSPDVVVLLHQRAGVAGGDGGNGNGGAPLSRAWSQANEEGGGHSADVVVMLCGPLSCACEELRHRSVPECFVLLDFGVRSTAITPS